MSEYATVRLCARDHAERPTFLNPTPPPALAAPGTALCTPCLERLRWRLREIPALAGHIRDASVPGLRSSLGGGPKVDGSRDWQEPLNRSASDDIDNLWASLAYWTQKAAAAVGSRVPYDVGNEFVTGVSARADHHWTKAGAQRVVDWLDSWLTDIAADDELGREMHDDLVPLVGKLSGRYGFTATVRRATPRACHACGQQEVRVTWESEQPRVRCWTCQYVLPVDWEVIAGAFDMADVPAGV